MLYVSRPRLQPLFFVKITLGLIITLVVFITIRGLFVVSRTEQTTCIFRNYTQALHSAAGTQSTVILAPFDTGFVDMTVNFYVSSIRKHGIENILFISMDERGCDKLLELIAGGYVNCVLYTVPTSGDAAVWGTDDFRHKNMIKRSYILEALHAGYSVLMTDVDMVYRQSPLPDLEETCMEVTCDLAIQWDSKHDNFNGGFIYARQTTATVLIYERQIEYDSDDKNMFRSDQQQLNVAIEQIRREGNVGVTVVALNSTKYPVGKPFFYKRRCPPRGAYDAVVALHNNYIREKDNKVFRLKECMLWEYDGVQRYYSDINRNYLTYQYTLGTGLNEYQGLLNAFTIGKLLNRTVILPNTFYRESDVHTNLMLRIYQKLSMYFIRDFNDYTNGSYRESSFLQHPLVPESVTSSRSEIYHIVLPFNDIVTRSNSTHARLLIPTDIEKGPTVQEIQHWFLGVSAHVLQFDSLYGQFELLDYESFLGEYLVDLVRPLNGPLRFRKYLTEGKIESRIKKGKEIPDTI